MVKKMDYPDFNKRKIEELEEAKRIELEEAGLHYKVVCFRIKRKYNRWIEMERKRKFIVFE
jgi:hypothetical protein